MPVQRPGVVNTTPLQLLVVVDTAPIQLPEVMDTMPEVMDTTPIHLPAVPQQPRSETTARKQCLGLTYIHFCFPATTEGTRCSLVQQRCWRSSCRWLTSRFRWVKTLWLVMWVWFERVGVGVDLIGTNGDGLIELMELSLRC